MRHVRIACCLEQSAWDPRYNFLGLGFVQWVFVQRRERLPGLKPCSMVAIETCSDDATHTVECACDGGAAILKGSGSQFVFVYCSH